MEESCVVSYDMLWYIHYHLEKCKSSPWLARKGIHKDNYRCSTVNGKHIENWLQFSTLNFLEHYASFLNFSQIFVGHFCNIFLIFLILNTECWNFDHPCSALPGCLAAVYRSSSSEERPNQTFSVRSTKC